MPPTRNAATEDAAKLKFALTSFLGIDAEEHEYKKDPVVLALKSEGVEKLRMHSSA